LVSGWIKELVSKQYLRTSLLSLYPRWEMGKKRSSNLIKKIIFLNKDRKERNDFYVSISFN